MFTINYFLFIDEENEGSSNIVNQNIVVEKQRPKLLQFSENLRPPYWGTWRKCSKNINPRRPFSKDMVSLKLIRLYVYRMILLYINISLFILNLCTRSY